ncbi:MAG: hypothetical protein A2623_08070 [Caulobacterales bacterium RIFCSPHIGHO2_01_FULL_70_19]|nr:MAG: hypothetical protein A2623_08070 [Caulobacterales bacterium RIFCSPHIGHO2_01_FULL_70_19]
MHTLFLALALAGSLTAGQALAQTQDLAPSITPRAAQPETAAQRHERCKAVVAAGMEPRQRHDHLRDKTGAATPPKPLSEAEMDRQYRECEALMAKAKAADAEK